MALFNNKRKDFSIRPPKQSTANGILSVTDSANIDFTYFNFNLTANLTQLLPTSGTYGDATHIPILQIDQWGRITGVTTTTFSASGITLENNGFPNDSQTILNLIDGTDIHIEDGGGGAIKINYTGTGGSAAWGSIAAGTGVGSQTDLITYLSTNYQPIGNYQPQLNGTGFVKASGTTISYDNSTYYLASNPSNFITASALTPYLLSSVAATTYYPLTGNPSGFLTTISGLNISLLTNDSGYITSSALTPYLTITSAAATYYPLTNPAGYITSAALAGYVPTTRTLTINGTTYDLSADRSWTISSSGGLLHGTTSGTDTYTTTITGATAYTDGDAYLIRFAIGNTTSATLNINSQGAVPLYRNNDGPLLGGDVIAGGEMVCVYNSTLNIFQCIGISPNSLIAYVTNDDSVTITKGQPVYAYSGTGDRMTVKLAYNTGDSTSAQTIGLVLSTSIAANQKGLIMMQGLLDGLSNVKPVNGWADGSPVYLGTTAGSITPTKQYAPNHLVYLGFVTTASPGSAGRIYVRVQNGFELDELHNVQAQTPANNDTLYYDNTVTPKQWKTASIPTILGYTPLSQTLANTQLFIGNASNVATAVPMSGDATIANTGAITLKTNLRIGSCGVTFDGGGAVITSGKTAYVQVPYAGTITAWTIGADISGSCTITAFKDTYANFPPVTTADDIFVTAPALSSQQKNTNASPAFNGSQATITAGDWIGFTITSITGVTWVNLTLSITKT